MAHQKGKTEAIGILLPLLLAFAQSKARLEEASLRRYLLPIDSVPTNKKTD